MQTKLRHVDIHNHWLRQEVEQDRIAVDYTPSTELVADGLTKALQGEKFKTFRSQLGLVDITDLLGQRPLLEMNEEDHIRWLHDQIGADYPGEE